MANYNIVISNSALKSLKKIPPTYQNKIRIAISGLATKPDPHQSKQLINRPDWSLRVGTYRVLYRIDKQVVTVFVIAIGHRKDVYR